MLKIKASLLVFPALVMFGLLSVLLPNVALAAGNSASMPDQSNYSTNGSVRLEVSNISPNNGLSAPVSRVKIYSRIRNPILTIRGFGHCNSPEGDTDTNYKTATRYSVYRTTSNEDRAWDPNPPVNNVSNGAVCAGKTMSYASNFQLSQAAGATSGLRGREAFYVFIFEATLEGGGVNSFTLSTNDGYIATSNKSTDKFALQVRSGGSGYSNFTIPFGTDCTVTSNKTVSLSWFDDDWNGIQRNNDYNFALYDVTNGGNRSIPLGGGSSPHPRYGNGVSGSRTFVAEPGHKYEWRWTGVADANGIQFQLPYDGINYNLDCGPFVSECTATSINGSQAGVVTVAAGDDFSAGFGVKNGGEFNGAEFWPIWGKDGVAHASQRFKVGARSGYWQNRAGENRAEIYGGISSAYGPLLPPGQSGLAPVTLTAPTTPGDYPLDWGLVREGVRWYDGVTCPRKTVRVVAGQDMATCTVVTIPPMVELNRDFNVTLRVTNTGTITLPTNTTNGIVLVPGSGNAVPRADGATEVGIGSPDLAPAGTRNVTMTMRLTDDGVKTFKWAVRYKLQNRTYSAACTQNIPVMSNRPFLRVEGSDLVSGGVFADTATNCSDARDAYAYAPGTKGYIKANGNAPEANALSRFNGFSSSQYGAFAIDGIGSSGRNNFAANNGYFWDGIAEAGETPTKVRDLLFANIGTGVTDDYGSYFAPSGGTLPCVDTKALEQAAEANQVSTVAQALNLATANPDTTVYAKYTGTDLTLGTTTVATNQRLVLVVPGKLTISGNITYGPTTTTAGVVSAPSLTIIAKGGINIPSNVNLVNGYYITPGTLDTCSNVPLTNMSVDTCSSGATAGDGRLQVFGGIAAKKILWKRNFGTLDANASTYPRTTPGNTGNCAFNSVYNALSASMTEAQRMNQALRDCSSERVRFLPSYYMSNPFVTDDTSTVSTKPLTTRELPPVY